MQNPSKAPRKRKRKRDIKAKEIPVTPEFALYNVEKVACNKNTQWKDTRFMKILQEQLKGYFLDADKETTPGFQPNIDGARLFHIRCNQRNIDAAHANSDRGDTPSNRNAVIYSTIELLVPIFFDHAIRRIPHPRLTHHSIYILIKSACSFVVELVMHMYGRFVTPFISAGRTLDRISDVSAELHGFFSSFRADLNYVHSRRDDPDWYLYTQAYEYPPDYSNAFSHAVLQLELLLRDRLELLDIDLPLLSRLFSNSDAANNPDDVSPTDSSCHMDNDITHDYNPMFNRSSVFYRIRVIGREFDNVWKTWIQRTAAICKLFTMQDGLNGYSCDDPSHLADCNHSQSKTTSSSNTDLLYGFDDELEGTRNVQTRSTSPCPTSYQSVAARYPYKCQFKRLGPMVATAISTYDVSLSNDPEYAPVMLTCNGNFSMEMRANVSFWKQWKLIYNVISPSISLDMELLCSLLYSIVYDFFIEKDYIAVTTLSDGYNHTINILVRCMLDMLTELTSKTLSRAVATRFPLEDQHDALLEKTDSLFELITSTIEDASSARLDLAPRKCAANLPTRLTGTATVLNRCMELKTRSDFPSVIPKPFLTRRSTRYNGVCAEGANADEWNILQCKNKLPATLAKELFSPQLNTAKMDFLSRTWLSDCCNEHMVCVIVAAGKRTYRGRNWNHISPSCYVEFCPVVSLSPLERVDKEAARKFRADTRLYANRLNRYNSKRLRSVTTKKAISHWLQLSKYPFIVVISDETTLDKKTLDAIDSRYGKCICCCLDVQLEKDVFDKREEC